MDENWTMVGHDKDMKGHPKGAVRPQYRQLMDTKRHPEDRKQRYNDDNYGEIHRKCFIL